MAYFTKAKSLFSTTLSTSISTGTGDTITLASVTGLPTDTEITLTFERVATDGTTLSPTKMERIRGTISGSNLTSYTRAVEGTEQAHSAGSIIEFIPNGTDWNNLVDGILAEHSQLGTHTSAAVTTLKATSAEVTTGTNDTKIVTPAALAGMASKTETLTNKTLTSPTITTPTIANLRGNDGWQDANETWAYASASTITVPAGAASKYQVGDKIKWTQTSVKYGVITAVADTQLTIAVNTDYTVANAAISANYYSHEENPIGYPTWFSWTPTVKGVTTDPTHTASTGFYRISGKSLKVFIRTGQFTDSGSGLWYIPLPTNITINTTLIPASTILDAIDGNATIYPPVGIADFQNQASTWSAVSKTHVFVYSTTAVFLATYFGASADRINAIGSVDALHTVGGSINMNFEVPIQ